MAIFFSQVAPLKSTWTDINVNGSFVFCVAFYPKKINNFKIVVELLVFWWPYKFAAKSLEFMNLFLLRLLHWSQNTVCTTFKRGKKAKTWPHRQASDLEPRPSNRKMKLWREKMFCVVWERSRGSWVVLTFLCSRSAHLMCSTAWVSSYAGIDWNSLVYLFGLWPNNTTKSLSLDFPIPI